MGTMDGVLLVSDFDDTLVDRKKHLPERTKAALEWFVSQGGLFTLASGRGLESVRLQAPGLPIGAPVIVANGTQIYDLSRENMLFEAEFQKTTQLWRHFQPRRWKFSEPDSSMRCGPMK